MTVRPCAALFVIQEHEYTQILPSETAGLSEEAQQQQVEEDAHLSADEGVDVCAVCLSAIEPADLAIVKGCEHVYCGELWGRVLLCGDAATWWFSSTCDES